MALQSTDLLVVQTDDADKKLYKLSVGDLNSFISSGDAGGTVQSIQTTLPLESDGNSVSPSLTIQQASASSEGTVARLAEAVDVAVSNSSPSTTAAVTANLLQATNANVAQNDTDITSLAGDISTLQTDVTDLADDIANLDIGDIDGGIYAS